MDWEMAGRWLGDGWEMAGLATMAVRGVLASAVAGSADGG